MAPLRLRKYPNRDGFQALVSPICYLQLVATWNVLYFDPVLIASMLDKQPGQDVWHSQGSACSGTRWALASER